MRSLIFAPPSTEKHTHVLSCIILDAFLCIFKLKSYKRCFSESHKKCMQMAHKEFCHKIALIFVQVNSVNYYFFLTQVSCRVTRLNAIQKRKHYKILQCKEAKIKQGHLDKTLPAKTKARAYILNGKHCFDVFTSHHSLG